MVKLTSTMEHLCNKVEERRTTVFCRGQWCSDAKLVHLNWIECSRSTPLSSGVKVHDGIRPMSPLIGGMVELVLVGFSRDLPEIHPGLVSKIALANSANSHCGASGITSPRRPNFPRSTSKLSFNTSGCCQELLSKSA